MKYRLIMVSVALSRIRPQGFMIQGQPDCTLSPGSGSVYTITQKIMAQST